MVESASKVVVKARLKGAGIHWRREHVKAHVQHLITATAINVARLLDWLAEVPWCKTRTSRFAALAA